MKKKRPPRDGNLTRGAGGKLLVTRQDKMKEAARRALLIETMMGNKQKPKVSLPKFSWDKQDDN